MDKRRLRLIPQLTGKLYILQQEDEDIIVSDLNFDSLF